MQSDLEVDADALRRCAQGLADTGAQVRAGLAQSPPLVVSAPGWATGEAGAALQATTARQLATLGDAIGTAGRQVAVAVAEYDAADDRAAARLRALR